MAAEAPDYPATMPVANGNQWSIPMGMGQLLKTVFNWSLAIVRLKIKDSKDSLQLSRFLQVGLRLRSSCGSLIFAALL